MWDPRRTGFVDESYEVDATGRSTVILSVVRPGDRGEDARQALRDLLLVGADFLHFSKEDGARRQLLAKTLGGLGLELTVAVRRSPDSVARARAVGLTTIAWSAGGTLDLLVLESREASLDRADADLLARLHPAERRIGARFLGKREDPLLWAADILASATFQAVVRGIGEHLAALGPVRRLDY